MRRVAGFRLAALGLIAVTTYVGVLWFVIARYELPELTAVAWALLAGSLSNVTGPVVASLVTVGPLAVLAMRMDPELQRLRRRWIGR